MTKRKHPTFERPITWAALLAIGYLGLDQGVWSTAVLAALAGCLYELFLVPTQCAANTTKRMPCSSNARGRLRACEIVAHKRKKRDAIWQYTVGYRNPFASRRKMWGGAQIDHGSDVKPATQESREVPTAESYAKLTITLALLSTVAAVISAIHDVLT